MSLAGDTSSVLEVRHLTSCPCGCLPGVDDCITERDAPDGDGHCCGRLGFEGMAAATRLGLTCTRGCVFERLRDGAA
jgi:hypothetical protein